MAGLSSKALVFGDPENKRKYNGIEFENALGIDDYEAQLRNLDPQVGRWWEIDPKTENQEAWSPYVSNNDNPIKFADPLGDEAEGCCGGFFERFWDNAKANYRGVKEWVVDTWNQAGENYRNRKEAGALPWQNFDPLISLSPVPVGGIGQAEKALAIEANIGSTELKTAENLLEKTATPLAKLEANATKSLGETLGNSSSLSPNVKKIANMIAEIKAEGGIIKPNPLKPNQEINYTISKGKEKVDIRIETHIVPSKYGGNGITPQRHLNVDPTPKIKDLQNKGHKIL